MPATISRSGLDAARAAFFEKLYRGRSALCVGLGDGAALEVLLARGAAQVAGIDIDEEAVAATRARVGDRAQLKTGPVRDAGSLGAPFDVVLVRRGETMVARDLWREVSKLVRPGGWLIAAAVAGDRDGAPRGAMGYAQLQGHVASYFPHVTMLAQSPFAGAAVIPYGDAEVEPQLDVALAPAPTPELYVAVAGPEALELPYGLIELPESALSAAAAQVKAAPVNAAPVTAPAAAHAVAAPPAPPVPNDADVKKLRGALAEQEARARKLDEALRAALGDQETRSRKLEDEQRAAVAVQAARVRKLEEEKRAATAEHEARVRKLEEERRSLASEIERRNAGGSTVDELQQRLAGAEQALEAARAAALVHAEEMRASESVLAERDAYVAELERDMRAVDAVREAAQHASARAEQAEARERAGRRRIAELEGALLRLRGEVPAETAGETAPPAEAATPPAGSPPTPVAARHAASDVQTEELRRQVAELEARCAKLQSKADDSERESWQHLKARSEAEAAAAEVREDTVRKLKDARKIANVELMRAMEEATRKAVMLKEELVRTERDRKEAVAAAAAANEELAREREAMGEKVRRAASEEASRVLGTLEKRVVDAEADRDRALSLAKGGGGEAKAAAVEVDEMLGDIERALKTETTRVSRIEESLVRALEDLRRAEGNAGEGGPVTSG